MKFLIIFISVLGFLNAQDKTLYTCSMHPSVIQESPGSCPICGMDLTLIKQSSDVNKNAENKILYWRAPMDANEVYDKPGKSKMGMDLVPIYQSDVEGVTVKISPALQQNLGVRTAEVITDRLIQRISTVGTITADETRINRFSNKFNGWIEKLVVNKVGQHVKKGDVLFYIYSPEVVSAQEEFVSAIRMSKLLGKSGDELINSARKRLEFWDISQKQIAKLEKELKVSKTVSIVSPYDGYVTELNVSNGDYVQAGNSSYEITNFSKVWVIAQFYEKDIKSFSINDEAEIILNGNNALYRSRVDYIYPEIDHKTRTVKARLILENPENSIKINSFAKVNLKPKYSNEVMIIPSEAVIKTGERTLVIIKNENRFTPRNINIGRFSDGQYEVTSGLNAGETIVTSSQFLIDSETKLKEAIQNLINKKAG